VGRHDEEQLRRFVAARRAGDRAAARHAWDALLTDNFDRVRAMVFLESRTQLSADEQEEALQRALVRMATNMIATFAGSSMGEYVEATRTLVRFACIDTQRRAAVRSGRERALDPGDAAAYEAIERERRAEESREEEAQALSDGRAFLDWAVPRLSPKRRAVIELDRAGVAVEEMQERLGVSRDVVYASRSRALKDLARLREEYPAP
jgi:RNA polymerase sigma factor (sigma-70 family)